MQEKLRDSSEGGAEPDSTRSEGSVEAEPTKEVLQASGISPVLCGIFFLSGAAALLFETLWFRLAGLTFGNSVWASALVLSAFMAGLALGNGLAASWGHRIKDPIRFYALMEITVAASGILLVVGFPFLTDLFGPLFREFLDNPLVLNPLRLIIAFLLMLVPATAMGMTLPVLVKALYLHTPNYGNVLGKLYGWNTLGAVTGALLGELFFLEMFGILGTGLCAGLFNMISAAGALQLSKRGLAAHGESAATPDPPFLAYFRSFRSSRLLLAGFLSGLILLAFEVVWFRFLILFLFARPLVFAIMLSVVLAGIALGGMCASRWCRAHARAHEFLGMLALLSGAVSVLSYSLFDAFPILTRPYAAWQPNEWLVLPIVLMFPVSFLSGMLFTLIGEAIHTEMGSTLKTTGILTMVNTTGAMIGSTIAGFVLLPKVGMEKSFLLLSLLYGAVALLGIRFPRPAFSRRAAFGTYTALALFIGFMVFFPFGSMERHILSVGYRALPNDPDWRPLAIREGLTETSQFWEKSEFGKPIYISLYTNNRSIARTRALDRRYMKLYVYLPAAVHNDLKDGLLICFGVGSTAKAMTDTRSFKTIDVVDISKDIFENSRIIFPKEQDNPLNDPRVSVFVEDGRFFLQTTEKRYDVITGEPPPPREAGVVNLYSEEYFRLMYNCLKEGGIVTYWLPVSHLGISGSLSVIKAFQNVFQDCTLWSGIAGNWMLVGTRNALGPVSREKFCRQWQDPKVAPELKLLGFEKPEQLGATFILDELALKELTKYTHPVTDNYPKRIDSAPRQVDYGKVAKHFAYLNTRLARAQFVRSPSVLKLWPRPILEETVGQFWVQGLINQGVSYSGSGSFDLSGLNRLLTTTSLEFPAILLLGGFDALDILPTLNAEQGKPAPTVPRMNFYLGIKAASLRDYNSAATYMARELQMNATPVLCDYAVYLSCLSGRFDEAKRMVGDYKHFYEGNPARLSLLRWLSRAFGSIDFSSIVGAGY